MTHLSRALLAGAALSLAATSASCADSSTDATPATQVLDADATLGTAPGTTPDSTEVAADLQQAANDIEAIATPAAFDAPDSDWRTPDPDNLVYIDTDYGRMIVELFPEVAPLHVERVRQLAGTGFYDGLKFHRVIPDFMNQTGDPTGTGTGDSGLPDLQPEFNFRRGTDMAVAMLGAKQGENGKTLVTGFYKSLPIATQPSSQAILTKDGKVEAHGLHCAGVTSAARTSDPATANSQFFLMRGYAPWLDDQYSIWGKVISGHEQLTKIKLTEDASGTPTNVEPDVMRDVSLASKLDPSERVDIQVLDTGSDSFQRFLDSTMTAGQYPDICDVEIPTRTN